ncbi:MAG: hypothetical protein AAF600_14175 [Bacteroidota bacterium]
MNIKEEDIDLLDQYSNGQLRKEGLEQFSRKLEQDKAFQQTVSLYGEVVAGIQHQGRKKLKERMDRFHKERSFSNSPRKMIDHK